jgi:hypothetical protein
MEMFEELTRKKARFETSKGEIDVEQLWDLPLEAKDNFDLDTVAKKIAKEIKDSEEGSFVKKSTDKNTFNKLKLEAVKHIIQVKLVEAEEKANAKFKKEQKNKILEILAKKQDSELEGKTPEELQKMLEDL